MKKKYFACSTCRFYPLCYIRKEIMAMDSIHEFIKHDLAICNGGSGTKEERLANICRYFKFDPDK